MDKIFKIGLLVLGFGYLAHLYCPHTDQVGRDQYEISGKSIVVFDTSNADLYTCPIPKENIRVTNTNLVTGKVSQIVINKPNP